MTEKSRAVNETPLRHRKSCGFGQFGLPASARYPTSGTNGCIDLIARIVESPQMVMNDIPKGTKTESVVSSGEVLLRRYLREMYRINVVLYVN